MMSESQFEKLLNTLKTAKRERDLARHKVEVQDWIINELREQNDRLRGLLKGCQPYIEGFQVCDPRLCDAVKKEVNDEPE